jgi:hypothetical protein
MAEKTHEKDVAGLAKVLEALKDQGHKFPFAYIAAQTGVSRQSVRNWESVPMKHLAKISELSGLPRDKILPYTIKRILG